MAIEADVRSGDDYLTNPSIPRPGTTPPTLPPVAPPPTVVPPAEPATPEEPARLSDITQRHLNVSGADVDYLRGEPYKTSEEQAMRARMGDRVRNQYNTARQKVADTLGNRQGFSGVMAGALRKLDEAEAQETSNIDRDIMLKGADEMRSRRGESRGITGGLEALERQRQMESLGIGHIQDDSERQRVLDLMAAMGGAPSPAQAAGVGGNILGYAGQLGQQAQQAGAANMSGIGNLAALFQKQGWL